MEFKQVKDSGHRRKFDTGAQRDRGEDKIKYSLIPATALKRLGQHYLNGSKKYDPWNWAKGMPFSEFLESLMRHVEAYRLGDRTEDHLSAICFNAMGIMHFEEIGKTELDDLTPIINSVYKKPEDK